MTNFRIHLTIVDKTNLERPHVDIVTATNADAAREIIRKRYSVNGQTVIFKKIKVAKDNANAG